MLLALLLSTAAACGDDDDMDATATTGTSAASTTTAADERPAFPPARTDLEHGGRSWAVVLAAAADDADSPVLQQAVADAEAAGYRSGPTDCDMGADVALGFSEDETVYTVSVYFETEADARQALAAFEQRGVAGGVVAEVQTFCLD